MCTFETLNEVFSNPPMNLVPPYLEFPLSFVNGLVPCAIKDILGQNQLDVQDCYSMCFYQINPVLLSASLKFFQARMVATTTTKLAQ